MRAPSLSSPSVESPRKKCKRSRRRRRGKGRDRRRRAGAKRLQSKTERNAKKTPENYDLELWKPLSEIKISRDASL